MGQVSANATQFWCCTGSKLVRFFDMIYGRACAACAGETQACRRGRAALRYLPWLNDCHLRGAAYVQRSDVSSECVFCLNSACVVETALRLNPCMMIKSAWLCMMRK